MHDKIVVADDTLVTGSFNFSANAARNAENVLAHPERGTRQRLRRLHRRPGDSVRNQRQLVNKALAWAASLTPNTPNLTKDAENLTFRFRPGLVIDRCTERKT